jgi:transcriptional antiterminator
LLSKALKLQQEGEDRKIEFVITGLENKIEDLENLLKEKYARLIDRGGSAEARPLNKKKDTQIAEQNKRLEQLGNEFEKSKSTLRDDLNWLGREAEDLKVKVKVKAEKNMKLSEALRSLRDTCFSFVTRCSSRL